MTPAHPKILRFNLNTFNSVLNLTSNMTQVTVTTVEGSVLFSRGIRLLPSEAKYIKGLRRFSTVSTLFGMGISGANLLDSISHSRPINIWDAADLSIGGVSVPQIRQF